MQIDSEILLLEWTTSLDTSSRTLFVRMWGCGDVGMWGCGDVGMWGCVDVGMWGCPRHVERRVT